MPLTIDTPTVVNQTIDTLEINSFAVDIEGQAIHIAYDEGYMQTGAFVEVTKDKMLTLTGLEFMTALGEADAAQTGSTYGDLKTALYARLIAATGLTGTVS